VIRATGKAPKPISLIYLHRDETSDAILHHLVRVEPGRR
jgi:Fe-S cluster assembly protein SufD